jgi:hypothetical protein
MVVLSATRSLTELTSYATFETLVEDFLDTAVQWVGRLARM